MHCRLEIVGLILDENGRMLWFYDCPNGYVAISRIFWCAKRSFNSRPISVAGLLRDAVKGPQGVTGLLFLRVHRQG